MELLGLGEEEVRGRLRFLDLTEEEVSLLRSLRGKLSEEDIKRAVDRFYEHILSFPELKEKFSGEEHVERVKKEQVRYLTELLEGRVDLSHIKRSVEVGLKHEEAGVEPKHFTGAFSKWTESLLEILKEKVHEKELWRVALALFKAALLRMTLALDAYYYVKVIKSGDVRYRTALEVFPEGVLVFDVRTGVVVNANGKAKELIGSDEIEGSRIEEVAGSVLEAVRGGTISGGTLHVKNERTGELIPVEVSFGTFSSEGKTFGVLVLRDLREKLKREKVLRRLGKLYETLSSVNRIVTSEVGKDYMISEAVRTIKEKGEFSYVGVFERESGRALAEAGELSEDVPSFCVPFEGEGYYMVVAKGDVTEEEVQLLKELTHDLSFGLKRIRTELHDTLTGLPNRFHFLSKLEETLRRASSQRKEVGLLVIDVDHFGEINEAFGHEAGDTVLKEVARRLKKTVRDSDLVARVGADEFALVVVSDDAKGAVESLLKRIKTLFSEPLKIDSREVYLTFSQGVSIFPKDAKDPGTLLSNAVASLSRAKSLGGDRAVHFSEDVSKVAEKRIKTRSDLRKALERGEFLLYYQPKVDLRTGKVEGCEALLRWVKDGKVVPPSEFIPILEEGELIHAVSEWVIREACRQMEEWRSKGIDIRVAVNVSPVQLRTPEFINSFVGMVSGFCKNFDRLEVEITESALMEDVKTSVEFLNTLASYGIRTYIDDFGTGYSSLAYLKRLPVYALKIDREFIKDLPEDKDNLEIVKAVILLAKTFGLKTVAEGTETKEQVEVLKGLGCDFAQGYYFSPPLPPEEFESYIRSSGYGL